MVEIVRVVGVLCAVVGMAVGAPAAAVEPARVGCTWSAELLPLPDNAFSGRVTGGGGAWLVGVADGQGVLWRDGRLEAAGRAFNENTELLAVNGKGVAVGRVLGGDGRQHAVRYSGGFEYLPGSVAMDVNESGDVVGFDGSTLMVWPVAGPARILAMPTGSAPYGRAVIDDDGTVVARVGWIADQKLRTWVYAWAPDGSRTSVPVGEVEDVRHGRVVGTAAEMAAIGWEDGRTHVYRGGVRAVAVNDGGVVVGAGPAGEPLLWAGSQSVQLPTPADYYPGLVTAINDRDAGGFVSPLDDLGTAPVRWRCQ
jgi:hypothetical protein